MPPATKRNRSLGPSDSSDPFTKAIRSDGGGRRGLAALREDGDGDAAAPDPSSLAPAAAATRGRAARQLQYLEQRAVLNYQTYLWAKRELDAGSIPDDGLYLGVVDNYLDRTRALRDRFARSYGDIVVFGDGDCGQLGCGEAVTEARKPKIVANLRKVPIDMVSAGGLHSLALTREGEVISWGCNDEGSLGWLATEAQEDGALPSEVRGFHPSEHGPNGRAPGLLDDGGRVVPFARRAEAVIAAVATGDTQSLALSVDGDVYEWGTMKDNEGRKFRPMPPADDDRPPTGHKDMDNLEEDDDEAWFHPPRGNQDWPAHVADMPKRATAVSAGNSFNAALLEDDTLVTWGVASCGELARPHPKLTKKTSNEVVLEDFLKPKPPLWDQPQLKPKVSAMCCAGYHLLAVVRGQEGPSVYTSGLNNYGQLGLGDLNQREVLTKVERLEGLDITMVEGGEHFSCFVDRTGTRLYACGRGDYGSLGITLAPPKPGYGEQAPMRVPLVYEPATPSANPQENCVVAADVDEGRQPAIAQISCGSTHVLVRTRDGDAYSWGFGEQGACGQGASFEDVVRPQKIVTKTCKMQYVSGGGQHSMAIVTTVSGV